MLDLEYAARPIRTGTQTVPPEWIDYNDHMNVAFYTMAFDRALDEVYEALGIGQTLVRSHRMGPMALQSQVFFVSELIKDTRFACDFRLLDADAKRIHVYMEMVNLDRRGSLAATYESLSMNVDLEARRGTPYPPEALARIERLRDAQASLPRPDRAGRIIGIRKR